MGRAVLRFTAWKKECDYDNDNDDDDEHLFNVLLILVNDKLEVYAFTFKSLKYGWLNLFYLGCRGVEYTIHKYHEYGNCH